MRQIINKSHHAFSQKRVLPPVSTWLGKSCSVVHVLAVTVVSVLNTLLGGSPWLVRCWSVLLAERPAFGTLFREAAVMLPLVHQLVLLMLQSCHVSSRIILPFAREGKRIHKSRMTKGII